MPRVEQQRPLMVEALSTIPSSIGEDKMWMMDADGNPYGDGDDVNCL